MAVQPDRMRDASIVPANTSDPAARSNLEPRLAYDDLRQWLEQARKLGEVKDVSGLSWQADIGMVAGVAMHDDGAPCFVFDAVPGTIKGSRVLVNFFGGKRKNMTLGFPTELSKLELSEGFRTSFLGTMPRIAPRYVSDGPIFENVMTGEEIDVTRFPAPKWHAGDGGRYIGTGSFNITRDPDEGWVKRPGHTRSATRGSCSQSPSISAIPGTPSRWAMSRPCATSALIAAATLSSLTTTSTCRTSKS